MRCPCGKIPSFGLPGSRPVCCKGCKTSEMINVMVKNKKCPCGKRPSFGLPGNRPEYCKECKTTEMVDVVNKRCPCGKQPYFGLPGSSPECCKECKTTEMVNVVSKRCPCGKQPYFGLPGSSPECCKECKTTEMVNVVNKRCPCGKIPYFGLPGNRPEYCSGCKTDGMVNVVSKRCPCGKQPSFGLPGSSPECCKECKTDCMVDVVSKKCSGYNNIPCPVMTQLHNGKSYCIICDPDDTRRNTRKIDEEAFFSFLSSNGMSITQREYRIDYRCIDTAKSHSFIDGIIISKDIVVCLEVDEEAHQHYDPICEEARLNNASAELRLQYPKHCIAWVRINPNTLNKQGKRDRSARATKIRDKRHKEVLSILEQLLEHPRDIIEYVGY